MNKWLRWTLTVILVLIGFVSAFFSFRGVFAAGIGWDSGIDTTGAIQVRQIAPGVSLAQAYDSVYFTSEFYGVLVQTLADWLHQAFTGATDFLSPDVRDTYLWQGCVNVALTGLGAASLGLAVGRVLRSQVAGAFAWALLWTVPLYAGMSHVDFKDMPLAVGLTMLSGGLMLVIQPSHTRWDIAGGVILGGAGAFVAMAQRAGSWPLVLAICGAAWLVAVGRAILKRKKRELLVPSAVISAALAIGLLGLWLLNPLARIDMPRWLYDAYAVSKAYPWDGYTRTAGGDQWSLNLPWWYVPAWLGAQLPVFTSLVVVGGLATLVRAAISPSMRFSRSTTAAYVPLVVQGIVLPMGIVAMHATLYGGIRHVLFMLPALAGIAAALIATVEARSGSARRWVAATIVVALVPPAFGLFRVLQWFPYAYAFVNPVASVHYPTRDWQLDSWGVTGVEGVRRLQEMGQTKVGVAPSDFTSKIVGGATPEAVQGENPREFGYYQFIVGDPLPLPPGCAPSFTIERGGMVLGEGAVCRR